MARLLSHASGGFGAALSKLRAVKQGNADAGMTTTVVIDADDTKYKASVLKAKVDLEKMDKRLDTISRKAARARSLSSGVGGAFGRFGRKVGISGEGFTFGAAKMGAEGFQFETGALLSASRTALIGVAITRTGAAVVSGVNKYNRMRKEGVDFVEAGLRVGRDSAARIGRQVSDATGAVKLMAGIGELLGSGDSESNEKAIFKFYSDFFTTQKEDEELAKKRREFLEEKTADAEEFLAAQAQQLDTARPVGFRVRDSAGLKKYRDEQRKINARAQAIKKSILIQQAEQQAAQLEQEGA